MEEEPMRTIVVVMGVLAVLAVLALSPADATAGVAPKGNLLQVKMTVRAVKVLRGAHVVMLQNSGGTRLLPIWIGAREAQAIQLRLSGQRTPRPLTHALLESILSHLSAKIERVEVDDLRNSVYLGKLTLKDVRGKRFRIDGRPSDLITLAVGAGLPVWVSRHVLQQAGIDNKPQQKKKQGKPKGSGTPI
jgi:bifunctional DNase/RNase